LSEKEGSLVSEKRQDDLRRKESLRVDQVRVDIKAVLETPAGRRALMSLVSISAALERFTPSTDTGIDSYNIGLGEVGREIVARMFDASPALGAVAMREFYEDKQKERQNV